MTPTLAEIEQRAEDCGLSVLGAFHPDAGETAAGGAETLVLLGPGLGFWDRVTAAPEWLEPDPIDRWSTRVIGALANGLKARAVFPFGGPPYAPFLDWAKRSGRAWDSPVGMLVHDKAGLMVSYRGALAFHESLALPPPTAPKPCDSCAARPCLKACPVGALGGSGYDIPACTAFLRSDAGQDCMGRGCAVRRSCPVSQGAHRTDAQSAHSMRIFRDSN